MNVARSTEFRNEDGIRTDAREGVRDCLALFDQVCDPFPLGGESGTEVGLRKIDAVAETVLRVRGRRPPLPRDNVDFPNPVLSLHAAVLKDHTDPRVPPADRFADRPPVLAQFFGNLDHSDVAHDIKGARQRPAHRWRDFDDVFVTPDGHESFVKLCLFRGKTDLDAFSNRQEDCAVLMADPKVFQEQALRLEGSPNLLRAFPRNDNGPRPHGGCDERGC